MERKEGREKGRVNVMVEVRTHKWNEKEMRGEMVLRTACVKERKKETAG
jgi:hypothetical protein